MYRSLNGDVGGDIWHQVLYASMHAYLLVTHIDTFGQGILNDMQRLVFYTQERRLISLRNTRDIELDDLDELPERLRMGSVANEFKYDVNESAFVLRAIVRYSWRAMLPIYIIEAILGIATAIKMFGWERVYNGELVAVVGRTGAGKSSLLLSICGEVEKTKGTGAVFGTIAYMEQAPIIINDTVRDNILFGRKYDEEHYNRVIEACALTEDINAWIKGDKSVIGDRGMKISGGQRARLALARTIYSKADIYVLDDPLSAVDVHVKRHILDNVIMDSGLLGGKLRILTVSSEKLLPYFNQGIDILRHYADMERDGGPDKDTVEPPSNWPSSGKIELRNFSMKYHEDLEHVLKNISLTINPGERIGIVGRTGAGKTSLSRAIFRLVNKKTCEGSIIIDGCDTSTIKTSVLRPKIGTIPQESTMFKGSFKQNLDPLMEYTIEDMWAALIKCNMVELVEPKRDQTKDRSIGSYSDYYEGIKRDIADWDKEWQVSSWMKRIFLRIFVRKPKLPNGVNEKAIYGLDRSIDDYDHFSDGQKQLFSLCRLLMRKRKIIVLDEATADVDLETDKEMQKLFRSEFKDSTVLTIAHRLETIMNSNRIIVMDKGRVVEFGPPKDLIDQGGYFSELVKANEF
ncbi:hypothetical protein EV177_002706 [Coemansia sp. RSA 1804]|nr:hypothetical protein EV177_002706 [Coemansia sp. RSA 1804]